MNQGIEKINLVFDDGESITLEDSPEFCSCIFINTNLA